MRHRGAVPGRPLALSGFTLVEVTVVVAVLGLIMGMSALAFGTLRMPRESATVRALRGARSKAVRTGRPVFIEDSGVPRTTPVLFLPDGRGLGDAVDPLTGAPLRAAP